jgi:hypothetical protein
MNVGFAPLVDKDQNTLVTHMAAFAVDLAAFLLNYLTVAARYW